MPTEVEPAARGSEPSTVPPFGPEKASFTPPNSAHTYGPPLEPRPKLAAGLLVGFLVWMVALWVMYFITVRGDSDTRPPSGADGAIPTEVRG